MYGHARIGINNFSHRQQLSLSTTPGLHRLLPICPGHISHLVTMQIFNLLVLVTALGAGTHAQQEQHGKFICYGALRRNTVPCSRRGASYYNCRPGAQANKWSRGCSAITRCRSLMECPAGSKLAFVLDGGATELLE